MISSRRRLTEGSPGSHNVRAVGLAAAFPVLMHGSLAHAEFPYHPCAGFPDPTDDEASMHASAMFPPVGPNEVGQYDFQTSSWMDPSLPATPEELGGVTAVIRNELPPLQLNGSCDKNRDLCLERTRTWAPHSDGEVLQCKKHKV